MSSARIEVESKVGSQIIGSVTCEECRGTGRVLPRLALLLTVKSEYNQEFMPFRMTATVYSKREVVATGELGQFIGRTFRSNSPETRSCELPLSSSAIAYLEDSFDGDYLNLLIQLDALLQLGCPPDIRFVVPRIGQLPIRISKTDWYRQVREPMGMEQFASLHFPIPEVPDKARWQIALENLSKAAESFHRGDDPAVFGWVYSFYDKLNQAEELIDRSVSDSQKAGTIKAVIKEVRRFFNEGRHPPKTAPPEEKRFSVDHRDAEFALNLGRILLAYLAKLTYKESS